MNGHIDIVHERNTHNCSKCGAKFNQNLIWRDILLQFMTDRSHSNVALASKQGLNVHICSGHEEKSNSNVTFELLNLPKSLIWMVHIASFHEGKKTFTSEICDSKFVQNPNLIGHTAAVHDGKKSFKCDSCDVKFAQNRIWMNIRGLRTF